MKKTILTNLLVILLFAANVLQAQSVGDFRTKASGIWKDISIWQTWDGAAWNDASTLPDPLTKYAHISSGDSVVLDTAMVLNKVIIDSGGILTLSNPSQSFTDTLKNSDSNLEINGHLYIADNATIVGAGTLVINWGGSLSFVNDAALELPVTNNGTIYLGAYLSIFNSTFTNNAVLVMGDYSVLNLTNSTLVNNDSISIEGTAEVTSDNSGLIINSSTGVIHKSDGTASFHLDPSITFSNAGILNGVGAYDIPSAVLNTGVIAPGDAGAGSLGITPYPVSGRTPVFQMEIDGTGAIAGNTYDQVTFTTTAPTTTNLSGSSLLFTDKGNTDPIGTIYTIMISPTFITGTFASVSIPPGYSLHYNLYTVTLEKLTSLDVTWGVFTVSATEKQSYLQWTTLSETKAVFFTVEFSTDGIRYVALDTILAKGSSSSATFYEYVHKNPVDGINYYRIRLTEENGTRKYSPSISLRLEVVLQIAPNPVTDALQVQLSADKASIWVVNAQGEEVRQLPIFRGFNIMFFGDLAPGVYQLFIQQDNLAPDIIKIVKL
jgi:hypothetical protein